MHRKFLGISPILLFSLFTACQSPEKQPADRAVIETTDTATSTNTSTNTSTQTDLRDTYKR